MRGRFFLQGKLRLYSITPAAKKVIYQPKARARDPVHFPRWRVGLICSSMRNFLAGVIGADESLPAGETAAAGFEDQGKSVEAGGSDEWHFRPGEITALKMGERMIVSSS